MPEEAQLNAQMAQSPPYNTKCGKLAHHMAAQVLWQPRLCCPPHRLLFSIIIRRRCGSQTCDFVSEGLQFDLVPGLVPLGSTWPQNAPGVLFTILWLGSGLGSAWFHLVPLGCQLAQCLLFTTLWLGSSLVPAWFHLVPAVIYSDSVRFQYGSTCRNACYLQHLRLGSSLVPLGPNCYLQQFSAVRVWIHTLPLSKVSVLAALGSGAH